MRFIYIRAIKQDLWFWYFKLIPNFCQNHYLFSRAKIFYLEERKSKIADMECEITDNFTLHAIIVLVSLD